MELHYISRSDYKLKKDVSFLEGLKQRFGEVCIIPEGGTNQLAINGVAEMKADWGQEYDCIATPFGSGGTAAGIYSVLDEEQQLLIFSALKGEKVDEEFTSILADNNIVDNNNWTMFNQYHFGGYAKVKPELVDFVNLFKKDYHIQLDLIYNGKMLFGLTDLIRKDYFSPGTEILAIHTGGVQGNKGMEERLGLGLY